MVVLKWVLIVLGLLIALVLIVALFVNKQYEIEREIVINKNKAQVFDYIRLLKNQDYYSKWNMTDPNSKREYKGNDGTVGFYTSWDSENKSVGKGEQSIAKIIEGERIEFDLHFIKPFDGKATSYMALTAVNENQTSVKWGFKSSMPYPMNIMRLIMNMEKMLGDDLQVGLNNLKSNLEK